MNQTNKNLTFKGEPLKVIGKELKVGDQFPSFSLVSQTLSEITEKNFSGKLLVISVIPSIDTPVCAVQTKRFNTEASKLSSDVAILTVSRDLPFAQKRWCGAEGADKVITGSDYKGRTFGELTGTELPDMSLLARAVFVVDKTGKIVHIEYVKELTNEPDYDAVLDTVLEATVKAVKSTT